MGKPLQKTCSRGHDLTITRRRYPNGKTYCQSCKPQKWNEYYKGQSSETIKYSNIKKRYGLSVEEYHSLHEKQEGTCAICKEEKPLVVDHHHGTGQVRGMLCQQCNSALGFFKDNPEILKSALSYLADPTAFNRGPAAP